MSDTSSSTPRPSAPQPDTRRDVRALVCASALVKSAEQPLSHHLSYDLSAGGVRLCGLPNAQIGEPVEVLLHLREGRLRVSGCLQRMDSGAERPHFTIQFREPSARAEAVIAQAVSAATLFAPPSLSGLPAQKGRTPEGVLLFDDEADPRWPGWSWLTPLRSICAEARSPLEAVEHLEARSFRMGLLRRSDVDRPLPDWAEAYPELSWLTIDAAGRLHSISTSFGSGGHYGL